jgi:hypothetical protein
MKKLLSIIGLTVLCSCSSTSPVGPVVCSVEQTVSAALAASTATALQCSNLAAIQGDMLTAIGKANLCAQTASKVKGAIGNIVCPVVVTSALSLVASKIPPAWGCAPTVNPGTIGAVLTTACQNAIPF